MLGLLSKIKIVDNSGVMLGRIIKILKPNVKNGARIGSIVLISALKSLSHSKFKPGTLVKVLIIRTKFGNFSDNAGILVNDKLLPIGNRLKGPMPFKLNKNLKLKSLILPSYII